MSSSDAQAKLTFLGHSAFVLTTESGLRIAIDPFLTGNPLCPKELIDSPTVDLDRIDVIIVTHGHGDHVGDTVRLAKTHQAAVFATFELVQLLQSEGVPEAQLRFLNKGGSRDFGDEGVRITLVNAFHSSSFTGSDGVTRYAGEACGAVIRLESGRTVYHAGDTCLFGDMSFIGEFYDPEVALVPIGDTATMGPEEAARAISLLKPRYAIPMHYGTFDFLTGKPEDFSTFLSHVETIPVTLKPGTSFEF